MQKQQLIYVYLALIVLVSAKMTASQVLSFGACPSGIETVDDFDVEAYLGTWYEYAKYPFIFQGDGKCVEAKYGAINSRTISVLNSQLSANDVETQVEGTATVVGSGKLSLRFFGLPSLAGSADYWVLATDYENYAVVYSCKNILFAHAQTAWILTRERDPTEDVVEVAKNALADQNISLEPLVVTDQSDCPSN